MCKVPAEKKDVYDKKYNVMWQRWPHFCFRIFYFVFQCYFNSKFFLVHLFSVSTTVLKPPIPKLLIQMKLLLSNKARILALDHCSSVAIFIIYDLLNWIFYDPLVIAFFFLFSGNQLKFILFQQLDMQFTQMVWKVFVVLIAFLAKLFWILLKALFHYNNVSFVVVFSIVIFNNAY